MKHLIIALSLAVSASVCFARSGHAEAPPASQAASGPTAVASTANPPGTPQRSKMKSCNADAKLKDVHGPARRAFMKQCLSGKAKPAAS